MLIMPRSGIFVYKVVSFWDSDELYIYICTWVSQKFCNILEHASLQHVYPMSEEVKSVVGTHGGE